jgi:hypothetical protein
MKYVLETKISFVMMDTYISRRKLSSFRSDKPSNLCTTIQVGIIMYNSTIYTQIEMCITGKYTH